MICSKCGIEIEDESAFCYGCGAPVNGAKEQPIVVIKNKSAATKKKKSSGILIKVILCIILVVAVACVGIYCWGYFSSVKMKNCLAKSDYRGIIKAYESSPLEYMQSVHIEPVKYIDEIYSYGILMNVLKDHSYAEIEDNIEELEDLYEKCNNKADIIGVGKQLEIIAPLLDLKSIEKDVDEMYSQALLLYESYVRCDKAKQEMEDKLDWVDNTSEYAIIERDCGEYIEYINGEKEAYYEPFMAQNKEFVSKYNPDSDNEKGIYSELYPPLPAGKSFYVSIERIRDYDSEFLGVIEHCMDGSLRESIYNPSTDEHGIDFSRLALDIGRAYSKAWDNLLGNLRINVKKEYDDTAVEDEKLVMRKYLFELQRKRLMEEAMNI